MAEAELEANSAVPKIPANAAHPAKSFVVILHSTSKPPAGLLLSKIRAEMVNAGIPRKKHESRFKTVKFFDSFAASVS
jgi:hypothetical protein